MWEIEIADEYTQAVKRGGKVYADAYVEGLRDGWKHYPTPPDALVEAVEDIARQKQSWEMDEEMRESADWQHGYNAIIEIARRAIQKGKQSRTRGKSDVEMPIRS